MLPCACYERHRPYDMGSHSHHRQSVSIHLKLILVLSALATLKRTILVDGQSSRYRAAFHGGRATFRSSVPSRSYGSWFPSSRVFSSKPSGSDVTSEADDEWYPHDPAWTTPQLLEGLWSQIAQAKDMVKGVSS
jgi:hypothetical protein